MQSQHRQTQTTHADYRLGDMIRRKNDHSVATQYGVIIGWDSWLQPLVFAISKNSDQTGVDFRIVTLATFEAAQSSELVCQARLTDVVTRGDTASDVLWGKAKRFLKAGSTPFDLRDWSCEAIASYMLSGTAFSGAVNDGHHRQMAA
ncbi:MAG: hypothetical protein ACREV4_06950 [Gammaproteobacteria bacterium]